MKGIVCAKRALFCLLACSQVVLAYAMDKDDDSVQQPLNKTGIIVRMGGSATFVPVPQVMPVSQVVEQAEPAKKRVLTISNSTHDLFMRIRTGAGATLSVYCPDEVAYLIKGNSEAFFFNTKKKIEIPLDTLTFPLRFRVWSAVQDREDYYEPYMDIDSDGYSIETCKPNVLKTCWCLKIDTPFDLERLAGSNFIIDLFYDYTKKKIAYRNHLERSWGYVLMKMRKAEEVYNKKLHTLKEST